MTKTEIAVVLVKRKSEIRLALKELKRQRRETDSQRTKEFLTDEINELRHRRREVYNLRHELGINDSTWQKAFNIVNEYI